MENLNYKETDVKQLASSVGLDVNAPKLPDPGAFAKGFASGLKSGANAFTGNAINTLDNAKGKAAEMANKLLNIKKPTLPSFKGVIKPPPFKPLKPFKKPIPPKTNIEKNREKLLAKAQGLAGKAQGLAGKAQGLAEKAKGLAEKAEGLVGQAKDMASNITSQGQNILSQVKDVASKLP